MFPNAKIHSTAEVSPKAVVGEGTSVWNGAQIRENAVIGKNCVIGKNAYIDFEVRVGDCCKIQNNASIYHGAELEEGVFVGPHVVVTNDLHPRAINADGSLKGASDWTVSKTLVRKGAALGASAVIICGHAIGEWAMVGAGAVVAKDVPPHGLVVGNPARLIGFVCECGQKAGKKSEEKNGVLFECPACKKTFLVPKSDYASLVDKK